jgi:hypothetical protein
LSPQTRRGRAAPPSHKKASRATTAARKPVEAADEFDDEQPDEVASKPTRRDGRPVRRRGRLARIRHSAGYRYLDELFGAYLPLFAAFVLVFVVVWWWISFGPHPPSARENWTRIESTWLPKIQADRQKVADKVNDYTAQLAGYSALRGDLDGWVGDLGKVTSWDSANATPVPSSTSTTPNGDAVQQFVSALNQEASDIGILVAAQSGADIVDTGSMVKDDDTAMMAAYALARVQIMEAPPAAQGTLALPSLAPCATSGPSASPGASTLPSAGSSASGGASVSPGSSPSPSPSPVASPSSSAPAVLCAPPPSPSPVSSGSPAAGQ